MSFSLRAFTVIELLVALTMMSFLTVTGLGMSYQQLSSYRFWNFQQHFERVLDQTETWAQSGVSLDDSDQWHLAFLREGNSLSVFRIASFFDEANVDQQIIKSFEEIEYDLFPLKLSALQLDAVDLSLETQAIFLSWKGSRDQWQMSSVDDFSKISQGSSFQDFSADYCVDCELRFFIEESDGLGYQYVLSSRGELVRTRIFSS